MSLEKGNIKEMILKGTKEQEIEKYSLNLITLRTKLKHTHSASRLKNHNGTSTFQCCHDVLKIKAGQIFGKRTGN